MKPARNWAELKRALRNGGFPSGKILLGLDFDGTLAPLARRPTLAVLPARTKRLLRRLESKEGVKVAVISGRSLKDVRSRIGIKGIHYAGNHGLEVRGPGHSWTHPAARAARPQVKRVARSIKKGLGFDPGLCFEDKGLSLSLHYREAKTASAPQAALKIIKTAVKPFPRRLKIASGKKVWEVRPKILWNKGDALLKIAGLTGGKRSIIFVGDDSTDEEGFKTLGRRAITVRVGTVGDTRAQYRLRDQRQVSELLELLCRVIA